MRIGSGKDITGMRTEERKCKGSFRVMEGGNKERKGRKTNRNRRRR